MIAMTNGINQEFAGIFGGFRLYCVFCLGILGSLCMVNVEFFWAGLVLKEVKGHRYSGRGLGLLSQVSG